MLPIRTITDLTRLIYPKMPTKAGQRAIREGEVHALGGFAAAEGFLPSWIVLVESKRGSQWIMQVQVDDAENRYRVRWIEDKAKVPWNLWLGNDLRYRSRLWKGDGIAREMYKEWKDDGHFSSPAFFIEAATPPTHHFGRRDLSLDQGGVRHRNHSADSPELGSEGG